jgi:hypothetical protein
MCAASAAHRFVPLLEADIAGYLYYLYTIGADGDATRLHLDTRLYGASDNDKFDFVVGSILTATELQQAMVKALEGTGSERDRRIVASKSFSAQIRPLIRADLVVELKLFAPGFTPQQNSAHLQQARDDIERLRTLAKFYPDSRGVLLVDTRNYVNEVRRLDLLQVRGDGDRKLRIYLCDLGGDRAPTWCRLCELKA